MLPLVFLFLAAAEAGKLEAGRYYQLVPVEKSVHRQPEPVQQYKPEKAKHYGADEIAPYSFDYVAKSQEGTSSRKENSDGTGRVVGSYHLQIADGRKRTVEYVADAGGFRAKVQTNEPGTKSDNPADVEFKSTAPEPQLYQPAKDQYKSQQSYKPDSPKQQQFYRPTPQQPEPQQYQPAKAQYKSQQSYKPESPKQQQFYGPTPQQHKAPAPSYAPQPTRDLPKKSAQQEAKKYLLVPYDGPWS